MNVNSMAMMVNTDKLEQIKAFYTEYLGFRVTFDGAGYLGLASAGDGAVLGFMTPNPEQQCMPYGGDGVTVSLKVENPDAEHDRLRDEARRYATKLDEVGALSEYYEVAGVDHGYNIMSESIEETRNT